MRHLVSDDEQAAVRIVLDAGRRLEQLVTEEEVEVEDAFSVVVGLDAQQRHAAIAGVRDDDGRVRFAGRRHAARELELIGARTAATEPAAAQYTDTQCSAISLPAF